MSKRAAPKQEPKKMAKTFTRMLPVPMGDAAKIEVGEALSLHLEKIDQLDAERVASNDDFKDRIGSHRAEVTTCRRQLRAGERDEPVNCEWVIVPEENRKYVRRMDSGEEVGGTSEPLTVEDRQRDLGEVGGFDGEGS